MKSPGKDAQLVCNLTASSLSGHNVAAPWAAEEYVCKYV